MHSLHSIAVKPQFPSLRTVGFAVGYFPAYRNQTSIFHSLDAVLLTYIARGGGKHVLEDRTFVETQGTLSITHYGQKHRLQTDDMDVYNIYFDPQHHPFPSLPTELQKMLTYLIPIHPNFYHQGNSIIRLQICDQFGLVNLLDAIRQECQCPGAGHHEMMRLYMHVFLMRLCREAESQIGVQRQLRASHPMELLRQNLDLTYAETHRLPEMAKRVRMHTNSLCRAFKAHTGLAVMEYVTERRLQAAMLGLRNTDNTILHVASEAGFSDISRFNRLFKRYLGISPGAYRKRFRDA